MKKREKGRNVGWGDYKRELGERIRKDKENEAEANQKGVELSRGKKKTQKGVT